MRFCPRCGFALAGVGLLMENDGVIPQTGGPTIQTLPSSRKKIMAESAIFTVTCWLVLILATAWFDAGGPFESLAKLAAILFFFLGLIGLLRFLYGFLFAKDVIIQPVPAPFANLPPKGAMDAPRRAALSAQPDLATDFPRRGNTKEMLSQPSVTEHTTRLLEEPNTDRSD
jgi:hypothetical protein